MFRYVDTPQFVYWPPLEGRLDCFRRLGGFSPVQTNGATNGLVHISMFTRARVSLQRKCGTEMPSLSVTHLQLCHIVLNFPPWVVSVHIPNSSVTSLHSPCVVFFKKKKKV